jgi:hypothetical protein
MVLVLNDVTPSTEERHMFRSLKKKFEKYNYLTIAENMMELDGDGGKKFVHFTRKARPRSHMPPSGR